MIRSDVDAVTSLTRLFWIVKYVLVEGYVLFESLSFSFQMQLDRPRYV